MRSVLGTLTGPRGLVVACVTDRRLLWGAVSAPAERSSLDANSRDLQLTTLAACHCRVRPAPPRPLTRVPAYSVSVGRFCGRVAGDHFLPMIRQDHTYSSHLHGPSGVQALLKVKKVGSSHLDYVLLVSPHTSRLLHDDAGAPPLCGRVVLGLRLSAPLPRYAPYSGFRQ